MKPEKKNYIIILILMTIIFVVDNYMLPAFPVWGLYVIPLIYGVKKISRLFLFYTAVIISILMLLEGYISKYPVKGMFIPLTELFFMWTAAIVLLHYKKIFERTKKIDNILRTVLDNTHVMLAIMDTNFNFIQVNEVYARADNKTPSFFPGKNHFKLYPNRENESIFKKVVESGETCYFYRKPFQYENHPERGITYWDWSLIPIKGSYNNVTGLVLTLIDVTSRIKQENESIEARNRLNNIISSISDAIISIDSDQKVILFNEAAENMFGVSAQYVVGKDLTLFIPQRFRNNHKEHIKFFSDSTVENKWVGKSKNITGVRSNGEEFPIEASVSKSEVSGELIFTAILRDMTEKRKSEEAIKQSEAKYRTLFETMEEGVIYQNCEGKVLSANKASVSILGFSLEQMQEDSFSPLEWRLVNEDGNQLPLENYPYRQALKFSKSIKDFLIGMYNPQLENYVWLKVNSIPVIEEGDAVPGSVYTTFNDITKLKKEISVRKQIEKQISEALDFNQKVIKASPVGVGTYRKSGECVSANESFLKIIGASYEQAISQNFYEINSWKTSGMLNAAIEAIEKNEEIRGTFHILTTFGRDVWLDCRFTSFFSGNVPHLLLLIDDITERKKGEEILKQTLNELERSNKELEEFAYVASHDLQEPLRMIASFTQLLALKYKNQLGTEANEYINFAVDCAKRMQLLINDLLRYSRAGRNFEIPKTTDCNLVLQDVLKNLKIAIEEKKVEVTSDLLPVILIDPTQLGLIFQNLLANAIKFNKGENSKIHVGHTMDNDECIFYVRDNGIGIEPQYHDRIFQIFQRLHREEYSGTGIGLSICKRIVLHYGGRIWIESKPDIGSTFYFSFPGKLII